MYSENGAVRVFTGNTDQNTVVQNFINPTPARYIQIVPTTYHFYPGLRVEIYGYARSPKGTGYRSPYIVTPSFGARFV